MSKSMDWKAFYKATKDAPPSPLLRKALEHVASKGKAIDLGAGALKDTRYLLKQGFEVVAVDSDPALKEMAKEIDSEQLEAVVSHFADLNFQSEVFDIASAQFALPFNPPETFNEVFAAIKTSLKQDGIFCGQLFGPNDDWSQDKRMTFHSRKQAEELLSDMEIIEFREREVDGVLATGGKKHWHVFEFIARKK